MAVSVGIAVVGGMYQADQASKAADTQSQAAAKAMGVSEEQYNKQLEMQKPWVDAGQSALQQLTAGFQSGGQFQHQYSLADFQQSPDYQYSLQQGNQALQNQASASGMSLSGAQLKSAMQLNTQLANQDYQQAFTNWQNQRSNVQTGLTNIANMGQSATNASTQASSNYANNQTSLITQQANAEASGITGQANAYTSALNSLSGIYGKSQGQSNTIASYFNPQSSTTTQSDTSWNPNYSLGQK